MLQHNALFLAHLCQCFPFLIAEAGKPGFSKADLPLGVIIMQKSPEGKEHTAASISVLVCLGFPAGWSSQKWRLPWSPPAFCPIYCKHFLTGKFCELWIKVPVLGTIRFYQLVKTPPLYSFPVWRMALFQDQVRTNLTISDNFFLIFEMLQRCSVARQQQKCAYEGCNILV